MSNKYFYCYSRRLMFFLRSMKFSYYTTGVNSNTDVKYWTFEKSARLDNALELWSQVKHSV